MLPVPDVPITWLVNLVNGYGHRPRAESKESENPYPDQCGAPPSFLVDINQADLVDLADRIWDVFGDPDPAGRAAALNSLLTAAKLSPAIDANGDRLWRARHTRDNDLLRAGCTVALLGAVQTNGWHRLGICDGADCVDVYIDERGRTPRRYCSRICLNRARIRAYRSRQTTQPQPA